MAAVVESVSTLNWTSKSSGDTFSVTKPTGLAVGDLMVAHIGGVKDSASDFTFGEPSGWTQLLAQDTGGLNNRARIEVAYKTADASDVAASNFTWTLSSASAWVAGAIYRISGAGTAPYGAIAVEESGTLTPSFSNSVTQLHANSVVLFLYTGVDDTASGSAASYAVANNNPTWTEQYDIFGAHTSDGDGLFAGATATRAATGATGNASLTLTDFNDKHIAAIVMVAPLTNATATFPLLTMASTILAHTITVGTTASWPLLTMNSTVLTPTAEAETPRWTNQERGTATWTNQVQP